MTGPSAEPLGPFVRTVPLTLTGRGEPLRASLALAAASLDWLDANRETFLHPDEAALVTDRLHARRRHGLLAGRFAAKQALARLHPEIDPRALAIRPGVLEQPVLSGKVCAISASACPMPGRWRWRSPFPRAARWGSTSNGCAPTPSPRWQAR
ncbi:hypothetical protein ACFQWF_25935 [Methylorubrum suomiense]